MGFLCAESEINRVEKGSYSPVERDDAQDFRGRLPSILANITGPEAQETLQSLAKEIDDERLSKWFNALSEKQAAKSISHELWSTSDVTRFKERYEKELKSSNELFQTISDRLEELKDDIKNGDFSERELLCLVDDEDKLQSWLAGRLKRGSKGQYHVTREEEVGRKKKPDIRLSLSNGSIVTLEVKPVGKDRFKYSLPYLEERLENQLVGQYMQDNNSRYGVLVILMLEKRQWRPAGSGLITFEQLIEKMNEKAIEIQQKILRVEGLSVVGIDCT